MNNLDILKTNLAFWSKLGFCYDPPRLGDDGKPIVFFDDFERFAKYHRDFAAAGAKIHTSILFSGWIGIDSYDYELTDRVLDAVFRDNPDIYYIPRIKLNVPIEWCKQNPEEVCVYFEGPREADAIRRLAGTDKHDILGYDSPSGYYTAGGWQDDRSNVGGTIANQSFSSEKWLADAGETLRRLIRHIEDGPYGKRIVAYQIAYGISGETCLWGRFGKDTMADYGIHHRQAFFDWSLRRYGSLAALREAWNEPTLERETAEPPSPSRRLATASLREFFRADDRACIDYDRFMSEVNAGAIEHFGKIVKNSTGKPVGCFYGYFLGSYNAAYTGWLGYERLLNSPWIDFFAAPKSYYRSVPGEPGGELAPAQSINRKKLWMDELDNRTHLCATAEKQCADFSETRTVMWREFAKNLAHGSIFWWMDLGGGWFDSPEILREAAIIAKTAAELMTRPAESIAEILLVVDEESMYAHSCSQMLHKSINDTVMNTCLCGAPSDLYRLADLETLDLQQYRLIVFLNTFTLPVERWKRIEPRLPENATLLWHYAPGVRDHEFGLDNIGSITGFAVREKSDCSDLRLLPEPASLLEGTAPLSSKYQMDSPSFFDEEATAGCSVDYPLIEITAAAGEHRVLARYPDGAVAVAAGRHRRHQVIYSVLPFFSAEHLRRIAANAGCHICAPVNCTVYADSRFIGIFPRNEIRDGSLTFKNPVSLVSPVSGRRENAARAIPLNLKAKSMEFFVKAYPNYHGFRI